MSGPANPAKEFNVNGPDRRALIDACRLATEHALHLADQAECDLAGVWLAQALDALQAELEGDD